MTVVYGIDANIGVGAKVGMIVPALRMRCSDAPAVGRIGRGADAGLSDDSGWEIGRRAWVGLNLSFCSTAHNRAKALDLSVAHMRR